MVHRVRPMSVRASLAFLGGRRTSAADFSLPTPHPHAHLQVVARPSWRMPSLASWASRLSRWPVPSSLGEPRARAKRAFVTCFPRECLRLRHLLAAALFSWTVRAGGGAAQIKDKGVLDVSSDKEASASANRQETLIYYFCLLPRPLIPAPAPVRPTFPQRLML
jgi:hypothetical protein